jgi:membrane-associated phospholipid phosphatase
MSQLDFIRAVQSLWQPWLTSFFGVVTTLGGPIIYILIAPLVFWLLSARHGYRLMVLVLLSVWINSVLKDASAQLLPDTGPLYATRPYVAVADVQTCARDSAFDPAALLAAFCEEEESFAFPSGHAQTSVVFWGYLALILMRRRVVALAVAAVLLIGFSRIYLGQHWPLDVLGGWLIGAAWLAGGVSLLTQDESRPGLINRVLLAVTLVAALLLLWLDPDPTFNRARSLGLLLGGGLGYALQLRGLPFPVRAPLAIQLAKTAIGLLGVALIYVGLGALLPDTAAAKFGVAALAGAWAFGGAPLIFARIWGPAMTHDGYESSAGRAATD